MVKSDNVGPSMSKKTLNDATIIHLTTDTDPFWNPLPLDIPYNPTSPLRWNIVKRSDIPSEPGVYVVTPVPEWRECPHSCIYVGRTFDDAKEGLRQRVWYLLTWSENHNHSSDILNYVKDHAGLSDKEEAKKRLQISWSQCPHHTVVLEYLLHLKYEPHFKDKNLFKPR